MKEHLICGMDREDILKQWDYWREQIKNGHHGSAPRDWFESILDACDEEIKKARSGKNTLSDRV